MAFFDEVKKKLEENNKKLEKSNNLKTPFQKKVATTILIIALIVIVQFIRNTTKDKSPECVVTHAFLHETVDMSLNQFTTRTVLYIGVPKEPKVTYNELKKEIECYILKEYAKDKPNVINANIYWWDNNNKTAITSKKFIGTVTYAPLGDWSNSSKKYPIKDYQFNYDVFTHLN